MSCAVTEPFDGAANNVLCHACGQSSDFVLSASAWHPELEEVAAALPLCVECWHKLEADVALRLAGSERAAVRAATSRPGAAWQTYLWNSQIGIRIGGSVRLEPGARIEYDGDERFRLGDGRIIHEPHAPTIMATRCLEPAGDGQGIASPPVTCRFCGIVGAEGGVCAKCGVRHQENAR